MFPPDQQQPRSAQTSNSHGVRSRRSLRRDYARDSHVTDGGAHEAVPLAKAKRAVHKVLGKPELFLSWLRNLALGLATAFPSREDCFVITHVATAYHIHELAAESSLGPSFAFLMRGSYRQTRTKDLRCLKHVRPVPNPGLGQWSFLPSWLTTKSDLGAG
eukprot:6285772-Amphidinium_carterae.1